MSGAHEEASIVAPSLVEFMAMHPNHHEGEFLMHYRPQVDPAGEHETTGIPFEAVQLQMNWS